MIVITQQPNDLSYSSRYVDISKQNDNDNTIKGTSRLEIGNYVFNNIPFTIQRCNLAVVALNASLTDVIKEQSNFAESTIKGIEQIVTLKYNGVSVATYDLWKSNLGQIVDLNIANVVDIGYSENGVTSTSDFQNYGVKGEYRLKSLSYTTTIDTEYEGVTAVFTKNVEYGSISSGTTSINYITRELLYQDFNPLDNVIDVIAFINGIPVFKGTLADVSGNSIKALGEEQELIDTAFSKNYYVPTTKVDTLISDALTETGYNNKYAIQSPYSVQTVGNLKNVEIGRSAFIDQSAWNVIKMVAQDLMAYMYVNDGIIYLKLPAVWEAGTITENVIEIPYAQFISDDFSFQASRYYKSFQINADFDFLIDTQWTSTLLIDCMNQNLLSGKIMDYRIMQEVETNDPATDSDGFYVKPLSDTYLDIQGSYSKESFAESTVPDKTYPYFGSIELDFPLDLPNIQYNPSLGRYEYRGSGPFFVLYSTEGSTTFEYDVYPKSQGQPFTGQCYFHIFANSMDSTVKITLLTDSIRTPPEDVYDGFIKWGSREPMFEHNISVIKNPYLVYNDDLAEVFFSLANSRLKQITVNFNGMIDLFPGDIIKYYFNSEQSRIIVAEDIDIRYNKDKSITTVVSGFEAIRHPIPERIS